MKIINVDFHTLGDAICDINGNKNGNVSAGLTTNYEDASAHAHDNYNDSGDGDTDVGASDERHIHCNFHDLTTDCHKDTFGIR